MPKSQFLMNGTRVIGRNGSAYCGLRGTVLSTLAIRGGVQERLLVEFDVFSTRINEVKNVAAEAVQPL